MAPLPVIRTSPDTYNLTCGHCGQTTTLRIEQVQALRYGPAHVPCGCGRVLQVVRQERRRFTRTPVQLKGALLRVGTHEPLAMLMITDLSLGGLKFVTTWTPIDVGQTFTVMFRLDDASKVVIEENIVVRMVRHPQAVGAAFCDQKHYNFDLDFYLTPSLVRIIAE